MKKLRLKGLENKINSSAAIHHCIKTVDGFEDAHIDMATGEITYTPGTCVDLDLLKEAVAKEGLTVEETDK